MALCMTDADKFAFIEMLRAHPWIWDCNMEDYKNRNRARDSYISIARDMRNGMTAADVKRLIKSLRTQYTTNLNIMLQASSKSGASSDDVRTPSWKFFHALDFLRPHISTKKGVNNLESSNNKIPCTSDSAYDSRFSQPLLDSQYVIVKQEDDLSEEEEEELTSGGDIDHLMEQVKTSPPMEQVKTSPPHQQRHSATPPGLEQHLSQTPSNNPCCIQSTPSATTPKAPTSNLCHPQSSTAEMFTPQSQLPAITSTIPNSQSSHSSQRKLKRKRSPMDEAVDALHTLIHQKEQKREERKKPQHEQTDNEAFFYMLQVQVSRLPEAAQDELRLKFHQQLVEAKRKLANE